MGLWETVEENSPNLSEGLTFGPSRKCLFSWEPPLSGSSHEPKHFPA